ncbi:thiamine pyrophosphate-binding protein [Tropicimonas sp. S265A]|uniref:thiamine pyrophosphate-binding protein n=1 Tax=Tropicimonas sp. S265A TaxID=3415134 RepID=UPI003C7C7781
MTGAQLFVSCLQAGGIDTIFALPGEETTDLINALDSSDIDVVLCRHEQAAAFMASVHGRLTGRPAVCLATLGPGATNLVTGVADATLDLAPFIAVTGQGARRRVPEGKNSHQIIDLEKLFEPVTKRSRMIWSGAEIPDAVSEALDLSMRPRPGAVHLSLPEDLASEDVEGAPVQSPLRHAPTAAPEAIAKATQRISKSKRPIVLTGNGVVRTGATAALAHLLAETGLPVASSFMSKGAVDPNDMQFIGTFGLPSHDNVDDAILEADLILTVGLDPVEYPLDKLSNGRATPVVALSEIELNTGADWSPDVEVAGSLLVSLEALTEALSAQHWEVWPKAEEARSALLRDLNWARGRFESQPPDATALALAVSDALTDESVLISGVGTHKLALARNTAPRKPGQIIIGNGLAGMGIALPGAIAAARLGRFDRVLAVCGDGEVMMNVQDMETASRLDLDITMVVWVDGGFGLIEDKQEQDTGTRPDLSFLDMKWRQLAEAFGWHHTHCETAGELRWQLDRRHPPRRRLITVPVSYRGDLA